jgi:hypothetical protein
VGLSLTTLEEVFLRIADEAEEFGGDGARPDKDVAVDVNPAAKRRHSIAKVQEPPKESNTQRLLKDIDVEPEGGSHMDHFAAIFVRRLLQFSPSRAPGSILINILLPIALIIIAGVGATSRSNASVTSFPFLLMSPSSALSTSEGPAASKVYNSGSPIQAAGLSVVQSSSSADIISTLNQQISSPSSDSIMQSAFSFDSPRSNYNYSIYINRQYLHALPVALNYLASNQQATNQKVSFTLYNAPMPYTLRNAPSGVYFFLLLVLLAFCFAPGAVISKSVIERVSKARHLLRVMGTRTWVYWASNFVFDFAFLLICSLFCIICAYGFNPEGMTANVKAVFSVTVLWSAAVNVLFCYLLAFFFSNPTTAQTAVFFLTLIYGMIGGLVFSILNLVTSQVSNDDSIATLGHISKAVFSICGLSPVFHIFVAPFSASFPPRSFPSASSKKWEQVSFSEAVSQTYAVNSFIYLAVQSVTFSFIIFAIEFPQLRK